MQRVNLRSTLAVAALLAFAGHAAPAAAQSDILLRLRSGSPLGDRFRVDSAGGVIALGTLGIGIIPFTGNGSRMMWYPYKSAFRAGTIDNSAGGWDDANVGFYSISGGLNTIASSTGSVAFGHTVNADGQGAVAIGYRSTADADYAIAIGQRASANGHAGAIVIADGSTTDSVEASANNQFSVRAAGGYRLFTNATETTGMQMSAGGSSWVVISDRNRKESFLAVDGEDMLARIRTLPVTTWRYRDEADRSTLHIGPMAQDWHRAFGFTHDHTTINMSDFDGVNLAAIKALEARTTALQAENAELREHNQRLEARLARLEAAIQAGGRR
jgi:trimeric autotransporter adhesin